MIYKVTKFLIKNKYNIYTINNKFKDWVVIVKDKGIDLNFWGAVKLLLSVRY